MEDVGSTNNSKVLEQPEDLNLADWVMTQVKNRPAVTLGAGILTGLILGWLVKRR